MICNTECYHEIYLDRGAPAVVEDQEGKFLKLIFTSTDFLCHRCADNVEVVRVCVTKSFVLLTLAV